MFYLFDFRLKIEVPVEWAGSENYDEYKVDTPTKF